MEALKTLTLEIDVRKILPGALRALANDLELPAGPGLEPAALPRLGADLPFNGGRFVGVIRGADRDRAVFVCTDDAGDLKGAWGQRNKEIDAKDDHDGRPNTKAMAEAGGELAKQVLALEVGKHKDWYIPSRQELALCYMHAKDLFRTDEWYWSSTQYSSSYAWMQHFANGIVNLGGKGGGYRVRAVRTLPL